MPIISQDKPPHPDFSANDLARYSQQLILPEVGVEGQKRLKRSSVLLVGLGGLGSPISLYLAAAGVGKLGLVDFDQVDLSNLHRQILFDTTEVGQLKVEAAEKRIHSLNPAVQIQTYSERLNSTNASTILSNYDIVVDGTDNFEAHYLINDSCLIFSKPFVYGSVSRFEGIVSTVIPKVSPCYRCLYPNPPPPEAVPSCANAGVLGIVPGMIGILQATEVLKLILKMGRSLTGRVLILNSLDSLFREIKLEKNPNCPGCGDALPQSTLLMTNVLEKTKTPNHSCPFITASELRQKLQKVSTPSSFAETCARKPMVILDVREEWENEISKIEGSIVIPLHQLNEPSHDRLSEIQPTTEIIVYCQSGRRARKAVEILESRGYSNLKLLEGGIEAYLATYAR